MSKPCDFILTKGKNRGKYCYEVNKYCHNQGHRSNITAQVQQTVESRPMEYKCEYCDEVFKNSTHRYRHQKNRCKLNFNTVALVKSNDPEVPPYNNYNKPKHVINRLQYIYQDVEIEDMDDDTYRTTSDINQHETNPPIISDLDDNNIHTKNNAELLEVIRIQQQSINQLGKCIEQMESLPGNNTIHNQNITYNNETNLRQEVNNNNYVQVVCISPNDDFHKILAGRMGTDAATKYILDCAKNNLEGDLNLLQKIYFEGKPESEYPIKFLDRSRNKVEFIDEHKNKVMDPRGVELTKRICSNLQNGYLIEINKIIEANLDQQKDGGFLDEYDIFNVNNHIYALSDPKYRKKLLNSLPI